MEVLYRHGVDYLVVGGVAAQAYGATRQTKDFDCLIRRAEDNLARLATGYAGTERPAWVGGLPDAAAGRLPVHIDASSLNRMEISTWRTHAGDFDVLVHIPDRDGRHRDYEDLEGNSQRPDYAGVSILVAGLGDIVASTEWANRPKDREALPELFELRDQRDEVDGWPE